MGRVFTTLFEFAGERHMAMVTVCEEQKKQVQFRVKLFNQELHQLIPEGLITYTSTDNLLPPSIQSRAAVELFQSVKDAIYKHLNNQPTAFEEKMIKEVKHDSNTNHQLL